MTRKERLRAVINGEITAELVEDCKVELAKIEAKETERKATPTENQLENEEVAKQILALFTVEDGPALMANEIAEEFPQMTRQRITAICTNLIREGRLKSKKIKVKGKGERVGYYI